MQQSLVVVAVLTFALLGCPAAPSGQVKASIGPAGGTLEHPLGAKLVVPAGALAATVELSIAPRSAPTADELGAPALGSAFVLGPEGQQFLAPVQVVLPWDSAQLPAGSAAAGLEVRISPQDAANFSALPSVVDEAAQRITAQTTHFSVVVVAAPGTAMACTALQNGAPIVTQTQVAQAAPTPLGGTLVTGVYYRTESLRFTGAGGASGPTSERHQQVLRVVSTSASTFIVEGVERDLGNSREDRFAGTAAVSGTNVTFTRTCPSTDSTTLSFTFAADTFDVIEPETGGTRLTRFTRQASIDAGVDDGGVMGACASVARVGPIVAEQQVAAAGPAPMGGPLASGTFARVAATIYTGAGGASGPTGDARQQTISLVASSTSSGVLEENSQRGAEPETLRAFSVAASGTQLTLTLTCPSSGGQLVAGYSLSGSELQVFETIATGTRVSTWLKLDADGGVPAFDAGTPVVVDAGFESIATGLSDLVDLELDATDAFTLGAGEVRRCALAGCGASASLVTSAFASSLAVDQGTLWLTTNFRTLHTCAVAGACTLAQQTDLGANTYPAHLWVANGRVYWISEMGTSRRVQVCLSGGCTAGYPKTVFQGPSLDGLPISGLVVNGTDAYVTSYTGGVYRIPLTDSETANASGAVQTVGTGYGTGGLDLDATTLRWGNVVSGALESCALPGCTAVVPVVAGLASPSGVRSNAAFIYGIGRGTPNGAGGYVAGTASIWRLPR